MDYPSSLPDDLEQTMAQAAATECATAPNPATPHTAGEANRRHDYRSSDKAGMMGG
jgi:hypothetical protein